MIRTVLLLGIALVIALLAALNWSTLAAPAAVSLGVTTVNAPLGLLMLGLTVALGVFFVAYVIYLQGTVLLETRRHGRALDAQRELADKAEASRFTELRTFLEARLDRMEAELASRMEQSDNVTAAHVGQLEDRIARGAGSTPYGSGGSVYPPMR